MKKLFLCLLCFIAVFGLCGCEPEDPAEGILPGMEIGNPNFFFRFRALEENEPDFGVHLIIPHSYFTKGLLDDYYAIEGYSQRRIAVAFTEYKNVNHYQEAHARAFDKLAEEYSNSGIEFVIIFTDRVLSEDNLLYPSNEMKWIQDIHNVKMYYDPYPDPSGEIISGFGASALFQPSTQMISDWKRPYTYYIAHDKIYKYPEERYASTETPEKTSEAYYYQQMSENIKKFIEAADKGV